MSPAWTGSSPVESRTVGPSYLNDSARRIGARSFASPGGPDVDRKHRDAAPPRHARRVADRPQGAAGEGEGGHPAPRRDQRGTPRAADGEGREELRVRGAERAGDA